MFHFLKFEIKYRILSNTGEVTLLWKILFFEPSESDSVKYVGWDIDVLVGCDGDIDVIGNWDIDAGTEVHKDALVWDSNDCCCWFVAGYSTED